jgi:hypothetical protein
MRDNGGLGLCLLVLLALMLCMPIFGLAIGVR